jgi:GNAT superfamily N-acetyltransferase
MQSDLQIRAAEKGDLGALRELYRQLNPDDPPLAEQDAERIWRDFSAISGSAIFVGLVDGAIVTTCTLVVIPNLTRGGSPYALIENVVTHAARRKQGYGRAVLQAAVAEAWRLGCYKVMLLTGSKNPATLNFYLAAGFEQSKTGYQVRRIAARRP